LRLIGHTLLVYENGRGKKLQLEGREKEGKDLSDRYMNKSKMRGLITGSGGGRLLDAWRDLWRMMMKRVRRLANDGRVHGRRSKLLRIRGHDSDVFGI